METYQCSSFLTYTHLWEEFTWSRHRTLHKSRKTKIQLHKVQNPNQDLTTNQMNKDPHEYAVDKKRLSSQHEIDRQMLPQERDPQLFCGVLLCVTMLNFAFVCVLTLEIHSNPVWFLIIFLHPLLDHRLFCWLLSTQQPFLSFHVICSDKLFPLFSSLPFLKTSFPLLWLPGLLS